MDPRFAHIRDWIFDLDNCLYPASTGLFALIDERMGAYIARLARKLAQDGISSLRFDCSNVADSPAVEGHAGHVLYGEIQVVDAIEAIDLMAERSDAPIIAAGRRPSPKCERKRVSRVALPATC